jgi:hypothetical protein
MKIKIREIFETISFLDIVDADFNYPRIKISQIVKYVILHVEE